MREKSFPRSFGRFRTYITGKKQPTPPASVRHSPGEHEFMKNTTAGFVTFTKPFLPVLLILCVCGSCSQMIDIPRDIEPAKAATMIQDNWKNDKFVVIDVRTSKEYEESHIDGAINIDFDSASPQAEIRNFDRSAIYLLYCRSGNRSSRALDIMKSMGFSRVAHIAGGINAWKKAGLRTVSGVDMR